MTTIICLLLSLVGVIALMALIGLIWMALKTMGRQEDRIDRLENERNEAQRAHIKTLGDLAEIQAERDYLRSELETIKNHVRQPGPTYAGLMDALAGVRSLMDNRRIEDVQLAALHNTLIEIKQGPLSYNKDKPGGPKEAYQ